MHNIHLLRRVPTFRALWLARTISFLGDTVAATALMVYIDGIYSTGITVSLVLLAQALPRLFGPLAGSLADRIDQRQLMIWCDVGQAALWASIVLLFPSLPLLLVLVFCASTLATIFTPAGRSALPVLVPGHDLPAANALLSVGINAGLALGPALGGVLVAWLNLRAVLLLNVLTFVISALLLRRLPALPPTGMEDGEQETFLQTTHAGVAYLAHHATARAVVLGLVWVVAFAGLDNVALVALAQRTLGAGGVGFGMLSSAYGIGMVIGPLLLLRGRTNYQGALVLLVGTALLGIGSLATGLAPTFAVAVLAQAFAGIGNGLENSGNDTLLQRTVPRAMLGRVFGTVGSGAFLAASLAAVLGGPLRDWTSPRTVFIISGSGVLMGLAVLWFLLPRSAIMNNHTAENID